MDYSFIIPVYNCKAYLPACVASIQAIQAPNYEILLIDDGSTDGSDKLCDELAANYPEIRVIHQANGGASAARNRGIREAQGSKLIFIDADDSIDSAALAAVLSDPRSSQVDFIILGLSFDYYKSGKCYRQDSIFFSQDGILSKQIWGRLFTELYKHNVLSSMCTKVFKRAILSEHHLKLRTDMFLYEDLEFVLRYLQYCGDIWNVPQAIYHYRQSEDEGNAKRRLARINSLNIFLCPIESALAQLLAANPAISATQKDSVLQMLYLVLAREKISVSTLPAIKLICQEFVQWTKHHNLPLDATTFQERLQNQRAFLLLLSDKKTALRHKLAVWVKSHRNQR